MSRLTVLAACCLLAACAAQSPTPTPTAAASPTASPGPTATASAVGKVAALLETERVRDGAPGMLALVRHGDEDLFASAGSATLDGTPIAADSRFRVGSITKPVVGALVLLAVRDGLFGLDDDVNDLVPGVLRPDPPVTVRQLLDHTAGVFDEGNEGDLAADVEQISDPDLRAAALTLLADYRAGKPIALTDRIWIALAETHDRYNAPGAGYHYSNVGYQVLGMILERASGQRLADLLRTQIVEPLGLARTYFAPTDRTTPEVHGYLLNAEGDLIDQTDDLAWFGNGANGGVVSTADELLTLMQAITSGELLGDELTAQMKEVHLASYGLGLAEYSLTCGTFYGHAGSVLGTQSIALVSEDSATGVVVAVNITESVDPRLAAVADTLVCLPH